MSPKNNHEKPPKNNCQEAQWQSYGNNNIRRDDIYTLAWEAKFGGHLFDLLVIYKDPNASDFGAIHTQGRDSVIVLHSAFHDLSDGQNRELCPASGPSTVHPSNPQSHGQNQDLETAADLRHIEKSKHVSESNTVVEIEYEPIQHPPSRQSDTLLTSEINVPNIDTIPPNELGHSTGG